MKTINYFFVAIGFSLCFLSCAKKETLPCFNFGEAVYDEPFVGLLKNRPCILVKSLQYPPFSLVAADTVKFNKKFYFSLNEVCVVFISESFG